MFTKIRNRILQKFLEYELIDQKDSIIYEYGLDLIVKKIIHISLIMSFGLLSHEFIGIIVFLIFYASLRGYSGGYHADCAIKCYLCTVLVTVSALIMLNIMHDFTMNSIEIVMLLCGIIIWKLSPQESENKPFQGYEREVYRKISHRYLLLEGGIFLLGRDFPVVIRGIAVAWIIQGIMLVITYLKKVKY